tara:strand:- start:18867 stop:21755 length:2889 start_codon:yes stop_codon:yes gene_type:complete
VCQSCSTCPTWFRTGKVLVHSVGVDAKGNSYLAGFFRPLSEWNGTQLNTQGINDIFVAKFDAAGKMLWLKTTASKASGSVNAPKLVVSAQGDVYVAGYVKGASVFGSTTLTGDSSGDAFVAKLDTLGNWKWAQSWGSKRLDAATQIALTSTGKIVLSVQFNDDINFDGYVANHYGSANRPNQAVIQLTSNGKREWVYTFKTDSIAALFGLAVNSKGDVYVGGSYSKTFQLHTMTLGASGFAKGFLAKFNASGVPTWSYSLGRAPSTVIRGLVVDKSDQVTAVGIFSAPLKEGQNVYVPRGGWDIFVARWDSNNALKWMTTGGGRSYEIPYALAVDGQGKTVLIGVFNGLASLGALRLSATVADKSSLFLATLDANGLWDGAMVMQGNAHGEMHDMVFDHQGALFLALSYNSEYLWISQTALKGVKDQFNGVLAKMSLPASICPGDHALCQGQCVGVRFNERHCGACGKVCAAGQICQEGRCVACTDCAQSFVYAGDDRSTGNVFPKDVVRDTSGNLYVVGRFAGKVFFGGHSQQADVAGDAFLAKIDRQGRWEWVKVLSSSSFDIFNGVRVDVKGNVYVTGIYGNATIFEKKSLAGTFGIIVAKLDAKGTLLWHATANGPLRDEANALAIDASGAVFVTGGFETQCTFGTHTLNTTQTGSDAFLAKLDAKGNWTWAVRFGAQTRGNGHHVTVDGSGQIYWAGVFRGNMKFPKHSHYGNGTDDGFLIKANTRGVPVWIRSMKSTQDVAIGGLVVGSGVVYISGHFRKDLSFFHTNDKYTSNGGSDVFVGRLGGAGSWSWTRALGSTSWERNNALHVTKTGDVVVAGTSYARFSPGAFVLEKHGTQTLMSRQYDPQGGLKGGFAGGGAQAEDMSALCDDGQGGFWMLGQTQSGVMHFGDRAYGLLTNTQSTLFLAHFRGAFLCPSSGHMSCGGVCTEVQNNTKHCGVCGNACGVGLTCSGGKCQ